MAVARKITTPLAPFAGFCHQLAEVSIRGQRLSLLPAPACTQLEGSGCPSHLQSLQLVGFQMIPQTERLST
eukprot:3379291-Amphidinium_carterae.1